MPLFSFDGGVVLNPSRHKLLCAYGADGHIDDGDKVKDGCGPNRCDAMLTPSHASHTEHRYHGGLLESIALCAHHSVYTLTDPCTPGVCAAGATRPVSLATADAASRIATEA